MGLSPNRQMSARTDLHVVKLLKHLWNTNNSHLASNAVDVKRTYAVGGTR